MRREFIQILAVLAIAFGAGLYAFSRHLDPPASELSPAAIQHMMNSYDDVHGIAAFACGLGVTLITFGVLCLAVPWVNVYIAKRYTSAGPPPA